MTYVSQDPSGTLVAALAEQINANGYAVIEDYVDTHQLKEAQSFVTQAVAANDGEYIGFTGPQCLGGTFLATLPKDPDFTSLCRGLYLCDVGKPAPDAEFYQILRCLSGQTARAHSMRFHYDSYVLTALIPIVVPNRGNPGRLIILPSTRRLRRTYLGNLVDKLLVDNRLSQALLNAAYRWGSRRMIRLTLKPGNLYLFWGYRSLHTNEPCDADAIRATALLHYADPHAGSWIKAKLRRQ